MENTHENEMPLRGRLVKRGRCAGPAGGEISMAEQRERLVEARFPCLLLMRAAHTHTKTPGVDTHRDTQIHGGKCVHFKELETERKTNLLGA